MVRVLVLAGSGGGGGGTVEVVVLGQVLTEVLLLQGHLAGPRPVGVVVAVVLRVDHQGAVQVGLHVPPRVPGVRDLGLGGGGGGRRG